MPKDGSGGAITKGTVTPLALVMTLVGGGIGGAYWTGVVVTRLEERQASDVKLSEKSEADLKEDIRALEEDIRALEGDLREMHGEIAACRVQQ